MTITKPQRLAIFRKWNQAPQGLSYRQFRARALPIIGCGGAITIHWCNMWLCIERDGYTHT